MTKAKYKFLFLIAILLGSSIVGCGSDSVIKSISGPKIEVTGQEAESQSELFGDYVVIVKCRYLNTGSTASITAKARVTASNGSWTKRASTTISANQEREVVFEFSEVDYSLLGDNSLEYLCSWES